MTTVCTACVLPPFLSKLIEQTVGLDGQCDCCDKDSPTVDIFRTAELRSNAIEKIHQQSIRLIQCFFGRNPDKNMASELMINLMDASSDIATKAAEILINSIWLDSNAYSLKPFRNQLFKPLVFHADTYLKFIRVNMAALEINGMHFQFTAKMVKVRS